MYIYIYVIIYNYIYIDRDKILPVPVTFQSSSVCLEQASISSSCENSTPPISKGGPFASAAESHSKGRSQAMHTAIAGNHGESWRPFGIFLDVRDVR
jgi:hypothetical protein